MKPDLIQQAKAALPLPELLKHYGLGDRAKASTMTPLRPSDNPHSWGIFQKSNGDWNWKDHVTGAFGDEIDFIAAYENRSHEDAIIKYLELAGIRRGGGETPAPSRPISRRIEGDAVPSPASGPTQTSQATAKFDWDACVEAFAQRVNEIAEWRGFTFDSLEAARLRKEVGWYKNGVAFPLHDNSKNIIGCHHREDDGSWRYSPKGIHVTPLIFGDLATAKQAFLFESQWDAFAVADRLGWHEGYIDDTVFIITRGASNGKLLAACDIPADAKIFAFPQNDPPAKDGAPTPAERWLKDVTASINTPTLLVCKTPAPHKDCNDWLKTGIDSKTLWEAIAKSQDNDLPGITVTSFKSHLSFDPKNDPNCILGNRWICRSGSALWIGQSGIGKSSLMAQAAIMWAIDQSLFGIKPKRSLRSLIIQAENDEGDIAEMIQGVVKALAARWPNSMDDILEALDKQIIFVRDTIHTSADFAKVSSKLIHRFKPDLVWGDPLLSYAGDDISQQKVASTFLRNYLNPVAFDTGIAWMMLHHTGKPNADAKARSQWKANDYSYVGLGSSELTNWARAVNVLGTSSTEGMYKLMLSKRGSRAGMTDMNGDFVTTAYLQHAEYPQIYWNQVVEPDEQAQKINSGKFSQKCSPEDVLAEMSDLTPKITAEWQVHCSSELGISKATFYRNWKILKDKALIKIQGDGWIKNG